MTTIDHRILIPAAPDVVWDFISDITRNPQWQVDCFEVVFLTSKRDGPGLRWRYSTPNGAEFVIAVTAWYNGLGYEYYFVDGVPFRENKGRIRLQEIPEGTIVQWTFTYELGGILGGVRSALGMKRQINRTIADSLKTLWQEMKQSGIERSHEAKSLMREAPDVTTRSTYQPRHPSVMAQNQEHPEMPPAPQPSAVVAEPPVNEDDGQNIPAIVEPPISDEDTRPRHPVAAPTAKSEPEVPAAIIPSDLDEEPEFLIDLSRFEPPRKPSDTKPRAPVEVPPEPPVEASAEPTVEPLTEPSEAPSASVEPVEVAKPESASEPEILPSAQATEPLSFQPPEVLPDTPVTAEATPKVEVETDEGETVSAIESEVTQPATAAPEPESTPITEPALNEDDTKSIWERFGIPRPSEIEPVPVVTEEPEAPVTAPLPVPAVEPPAAPSKLPTSLPRTGLRIVLRRKLVRLRRPSATT